MNVIMRDPIDVATGEWTIPPEAAKTALDNIANKMDDITKDMKPTETIVIGSLLFKHYAHWLRRYSASLSCMTEEEG